MAVKPLFPFPRLQPYQHQMPYAVFTRLGGVSAPPLASLNLSTAVQDDEAHLRENRRRAFGWAGRTDQTLVHARLVHGNTVTQVGQAQQGWLMPATDALITNEQGCGLTMNFADCAPIFLLDPINHAIGLAHAGWQGTVEDVAGAMVHAMEEAFGSEPAQLIAGIGPCIRACCYEVDEPVISQVRHAFANGEELLPAQPHKSRPHFALAQANVTNLQRAGVTQIDVAPYCTACRTDLFFSHRAEKGKTGRFGVLFVLQAKTNP